MREEAIPSQGELIKAGLLLQQLEGYYQLPNVSCELDANQNRT